MIGISIIYSFGFVVMKKHRANPFRSTTLLTYGPHTEGSSFLLNVEPFGNGNTLAFEDFFKNSDVVIQIYIFSE